MDVLQVDVPRSVLGLRKAKKEKAHLRQIAGVTGGLSGGLLGWLLVYDTGFAVSISQTVLGSVIGAIVGMTLALFVTAEKINNKLLGQ
jgi:hypothetical protein